MNTFKLKIISKEGTLFDGEVISITSKNDKGIFDVLATHANFISLIQDKVEIVDSKNNKKEFTFSIALMRVKGNYVEIYIGIDGMRLE